MKAFVKKSSAHAHGSPAFSLIEIMVVVTLMSVIILGLMSMFTQTQRAFRLGMIQTDVLESGRIATDMIARELSQVTPNYVAATPFNAPNFYTAYAFESDQGLPTGSATAISRSNFLQDVFFVTRENQNWTGIGYFVRPNGTNGTTYGPVASLYRYEADNNFPKFQTKPGAMFNSFIKLTTTPGPNNLTTNVSKVLDGVVSFRVRAYDTNGVWIAPPFGTVGTYLYHTNIWANAPLLTMPKMPEIASYQFYSNAVPAFVEFEVGLLEQKTLEQYESIPVPAEQQKFLQRQAAHVHLFRQRVSVRNVDWSAYQ